MRFKTAFTVVLLALAAASANSSGLSSARAMAMGGAFTGLARGVYAPLYNPANLGLSGYREIGLELAGVGVDITNNSFTLKEYNEYTGSLLTEDDKSRILGKIPAEGLKVSAEAEARALSFALSSFVVSVTAFAGTEVNLGKDALELFLNGNKLNDAFSLEGMYSEAAAYASAGISYGTSLYKTGDRQLAVGGTIKYLQGIGYEEVTELRGGVITLVTGFEGEGTMIARTSTGGRGYAVDMGAALRLSNDYTVGICFSNLISKMSWNLKTEEHGYHFELDSATAENMDQDSIIISDDYSVDIPPFTTRLPTVMRAGLAKTSGRLHWAVDYVQGFRLAAGSSSKPKLSTGIEYGLIRFVPLRCGLSFGGGDGTAVSIGTGVDLAAFYADLAVSNHSGFDFGSAKGLHLSVATGLRF
jgi:hypothetical protein